MPFATAQHCELMSFSIDIDESNLISSLRLEQDLVKSNSLLLSLRGLEFSR